MTVQQVSATGLFPGGLLDLHPTGCTGTEDPAHTTTIDYDAKNGVYMIGGENAHTPEGIGSGATVAQFEKTYPVPADPTWPYNEQYSEFGDLWAQVPGNPAAEYVAEFRQGKVWYVFLKSKAEKDC